MSHGVSEDDRGYRVRFEAGGVGPGEFDHRAHLRLAYVYLTEHGVDGAHREMRGAIQGFLAHHGVDGAKYHETMTRAWVMAVRHFMGKTEGCDSFDSFIDRNAVLLDPKIMLTHYSGQVLSSDEARAGFVEPDVEAIPGEDGELGPQNYSHKD